MGEHAWIQDERDGILAWILLVWVSMLESKMSVMGSSMHAIIDPRVQSSLCILAEVRVCTYRSNQAYPAGMQRWISM